MRVGRIVDLSVPIAPTTVVYPGDPQPELRPATTIERDGFNVLHVNMGSQTGTHVDAPYHFEASGERVDELDLHLFLGGGVVVDARGSRPRNPLQWGLFEPYAAEIGPGTVVLICTGWAHRWGDPSYFDHPYLDADACRRLLGLGLRTFCIDAINLDETPDDSHPGVGYPVHHLIANAGGVIGENFRNLDAIDFPNPFVSCLPIALSGADGAPVRAVAMEVVA